MGMLEDALREYAKFEDRATDPSTPGSGEGLIYFKDGKIHSIDDAGTVVEYGSGGGGGLAFSGAHVYRSTNQSIPNNTLTAVSFDSEVFDTDDYHENVTNATRLTVPNTGRYHLVAGVAWASHGTGKRDIGFRVDGSTFQSFKTDHVASNLALTQETVRAALELTASQYVEIMVRQDSGVSLNINSGGEYAIRAEIVQVS